MTATTNPTGAIVDLGAPDGGRYWRVTTGEPADHPDAISAAVHARVTGSVGGTYNEVRVERVEPDPAAKLREIVRGALYTPDRALWLDPEDADSISVDVVEALLTSGSLTALVNARRATR